MDIDDLWLSLHAMNTVTEAAWLNISISTCSTRIGARGLGNGKRRFRLKTVFGLVGTNRGEYEDVKSLSRTFAGR